MHIVRVWQLGQRLKYLVTAKQLKPVAVIFLARELETRNQILFDGGQAFLSPHQVFETCLAPTCLCTKPRTVSSVFHFNLWCPAQIQ